jgi:F-type H+-transporting ATPase subunit b
VQIDWFTVGAQILNFLVLIWLMKHFLYQPILSAIDAREQRIAAALADAATKDDQAQRARAEFEDKNVQFEAQRADLVQQMTAEVETQRTALLDHVREAAEALSL